MFLHENIQDVMMHRVADHICKSANKRAHMMTTAGVLETDWRGRLFDGLIWVNAERFADAVGDDRTTDKMTESLGPYFYSCNGLSTQSGVFFFPSKK